MPLAPGAWTQLPIELPAVASEDGDSCGGKELSGLWVGVGKAPRRRWPLASRKRGRRALKCNAHLGLVRA